MESTTTVTSNPTFYNLLFNDTKNENHIVVYHFKLTNFYFVSFKIHSMNTFYTKIYRSGVECQFEDDSGDIFVK